MTALRESFPLSDQQLRISPHSASLCEPPPYNVNIYSEPADSACHLGVAIVARMGIRFDSSIAWPGGFLTGEVGVAPEALTPNAVLDLRVIKTEKAYRPRHLGLREKIATVRKTVMSTQFPLHQSLSPDMRYAIPFSIKLPNSLGHCPCDCDVEHAGTDLAPHSTTQTVDGLPVMHCDLPPSLGDDTEVSRSMFRISISYCVRARILGTPLQATQKFRMFSDPSNLNLDHFVDASGHRLSRTRSSTYEWQRKSFITKTLTIGTMVISANPLYYDLSSHRLNHITLHLRLQPTADAATTALGIAEFAVSRVRVSVYKSVLTNHRGLKNVIDPVRSSSTNRCYKIPAAEMCTGYQLSSDNQSKTDWSLTVYFRSNTSMIISTPSFISCLSAVLYELSFEIKHTHGTCIFQIPLVSRGDALPSYGHIYGGVENEVYSPSEGAPALTPESSHDSGDEPTDHAERSSIFKLVRA